jgi:hypothetical protein
VRAIIVAICETVIEAGEQGAPSGVVYAALNSYGISLDLYNAILSTLKDAKLIKESHHLLTWIGPSESKS